MARFIVLDSSPLWLLIKPPAHAPGARCRAWLQARELAGDRVVLPAIADYEVRRELLRRRATAAIARLDQLITRLQWSPLSDDALRLAASLWARSRDAGLPTASPDAIDADVIVAAQAILLISPGDTVLLATSNVGHLSRYVTAQLWDAIV